MSKSVKVVPRVWVAHRIEGCVGVGEVVELNYLFPDEEAYEVDFRMKQGEGMLQVVNSCKGTAVFEAGELADDVVISVVRLPEEQEVGFVGLHVVAPTHLRFTKWGNTQHTHDCADAGFRGELYLLPAGVSYENLLLREGACRAAAEGYYERHGELLDFPATSVPVGVIGGNRVNGLDGVYSGKHALPWSTGVMSATIPWEYCCVGTHNWQPFVCVDYEKRIEPNGTVSIRKFNAGPSMARPEDPTQTP